MSARKLDHSVATLKLYQNHGNYRKTARDLGVSPTTLYALIPKLDIAHQSSSESVLSPVQLDTYPHSLTPDLNTPQTQQGLSPSEQPEIPGKTAKIALLSQVVDAYWGRVLESVNEQKVEQLATVGNQAIQRLQELVEGRHKQGPAVTEQHLHTGPEYHSTTSRNAQRHPKQKRK